MLDKKGVIVGFLSAVVIFFTVFLSGIFLVSDPLLRQMVTFSLTARSIAEAYQTPVATGEAFVDAERHLLGLLDPFSFRMERGEYHQLLEESTGKYGGVGITVVTRDTALMVVTVREGGPADKAGMLSGDFIISIDSVRVEVEDPLAAVDEIRGPSGTDVTLTIYRPAIKDSLTLTLKRENIVLEHIPYYGMTEKNAAYIRVADFEAGTAREFEDAVTALEKENPNGYIIDLKNNPGGYLDEVIEIADLFLSVDELIVGIDSRSRWDSRRYYSTSDPVTEKPTVILIDRGSASAAEIFTGALRAASRAVVVGDTTFGKGLVQSLFQLPDGEALRLTTSRYYFSDGRYLNPPDAELEFVGLAPDIVFSEDGETAFREHLLSGFLLYDFTEEYWDMLSAYPDEFNYPDTVVELFAAYARARGFAYRSWLTETLTLSNVSLLFEDVSREMIAHLQAMLEKSRQYDADVFSRQADLVKYHIRRIVIERKSGRRAMYRHVIVANRPDIRLAEEIIRDGKKYQSILESPTDHSDQAVIHD